MSNLQPQKIADQSMYIYFVSAIAAMAGLLFGFDAGVISGALQFIVRDFQIESSNFILQESIVASVPCGGILGALVSKNCSSFLGRRKSIILTATMFIIGTLVAGYAFNVYCVILGRLVMGLAVGISAMIVPMYLSEISPVNIRGRVVFCYQLAVTIGLLSAFIVNYCFSGDGDWRAMFLVGMVPSIILGVGMYTLPESPRWLAKNGNLESARSILIRTNGDPNVAETELNDIIKSLGNENKSLMTLFSYPIRKVTLLCCSMFAFQQLSGINTVMYYAPTIYSNAGFSNAREQIAASLINGVVFVLATVLGTWLVDKLGRRLLLNIGFIGMIICLFVLGKTFQNFTDTNNTAILSILSIEGYIVFFAISLGPLCYLIMSELFPLNMKDVGMSVASLSNWFFNVLVSSTFLSLVNILGISYTFYLYTMFTTVGFIVCFFLMPETKSISLEEMEKKLYSGRKIRYIGR